ncbi:MAG: histidine kinase dimerization/phospho-acceptor domain-containing protein, partial [Bacilli bacterium]
MNKSKTVFIIFGMLLMLLMANKNYAEKINICDSSKIIRVGVLKLPFLSINREGYEDEQGVMVELLDSLFNQMNIVYIKVDCNFNNALNLLKNGKIDILPLEDGFIRNNTLFARSYPIIRTSPVMLTRRFTKIPKLDVLIDRHAIITNKFETVCFEKIMSNYANDHFIIAPDIALNKLKNKEIDAIVCNSIVINKIFDCDEFSILKYRITKLKNINFVYSFALIKGINSDLLHKINKGIEHLVYSDTKEKILKKWNFYDGYTEYVFKYELIYSSIIFSIVVLCLFILLYVRINSITFKRLKYKADINNIVLANVEHPISVYKANDTEPVYKNAQYLEYERKYLKSDQKYTKYGARIKKINKGVVKNIINTGRIYSRTNTDIFDNGKYISMLRYAAPFKTAKNEECICMVETDITQIIEASLQAEKAEKLKSLFLANMSHDIRTPLNAIVGFVGLLTEGSSKEETLQYSEIISKNTDYLLSLLNDTVDLARFKVGDTKSEFIWFDLKNT